LRHPHESISIADYFTITSDSGEVSYGQLATMPTTGRRRHAVLARTARPSRPAAHPRDPRRGRHPRRHRRARLLLYGHAATPTGSARGCRSRRPASSRLTRTPPACKSPPRCWPAWSGRWRTPMPESSRPTRSTSPVLQVQRPYLVPSKALHHVDAADGARRCSADIDPDDPCSSEMSCPLAEQDADAPGCRSPR